MPELESSLSLDVEPALASLATVESAGIAALENIASTGVDVSVALDTTQVDEAASALAAFADPAVTVDVDYGQVDDAAAALADLVATVVSISVDVDSSGIDGAAADLSALTADQTVAVSVDVDDGAVEGLSSLGGDASVTVELDADSLAYAELQIAELGAATVVVSVVLDDGDLSAAEAALDALAPVVISVDTADVQSATADVEGLAEAADAVVPPDVSGGGLPEFSQQADAAAESTRSLTTASDNFTAFALGSSGAIKGALTSISPAAAAATAAVGTFFYTAFRGAAEADTAMSRFTDVFGRAGETVESVDIGGLNTSLEQLAIQLGADDDKVRIAAAGLGALGVQAGATQTEVAAVAEQFLVVSSYLSATNPALGTTEDVMARLGPALIRGGAAASRLGLSLSSTEVAARASEIALARGSTTINAYDKQAAALAITTEKLGDKLGAGIERGSKRADVQLRSFQQKVEEAVEGAGAALLDPGLALGEQLFSTLAAVIDLVGESAAKVVPLFAGAVSALGLGVSALEPLLGLLEDVPAPILQAGVVFLALSKTLPALASGIGGVASRASGAADRLHAFGAAGKLDSLATGARNVSGLAAASGGAERAAFRLEAGLRAQDKAAVAGSISAGRLAGAERAAALAATGASTAQQNSARALTAKELSAIGAAGGLGALTVQERLASVATLAHAGDVKGTQVALASLGVTTKVTKAGLQGVALAAETAGAAAAVAGTKAKGAGLSFGAMLGPLTLLLTIGFTVAQMLGVFDDEVDKAETSANEFVKAVDGAAASLDAEATAALAAAGATGDFADSVVRAAEEEIGKLLGDDVIRDLGNAGITMRELTEAVLSGGTAFAEIRGELVKTGVVTADFSDSVEATTVSQAHAQQVFREEFARTGDAYEAYITAAARASGVSEGQVRTNREVVIGNKELVDNLGVLEEKYREHTATTLAQARAELQNADATDVRSLSLLANEKQLGLLTPAEQYWAKALLNSAGALHGNKDATEALAAEQERAEEEVKALADAYSALDDTLSQALDAYRDFLGIPLTAFEKQLQFAEDTASLADATKEAGIALDATGRAFATSTEAGLKQGDAFAQVAAHGLDAARAAEATADGAAGAAAEIDKYRAVIVNAAQAGGATVEQAEALADSLGLIRGRVFSAEVVVDGLKEAREIQEALQIGLGLLPTPVVLNIEADEAIEAQEVVEATVAEFDKVPAEKRTKFAVDFAEMVDALGLDAELRGRGDIAKILKVAADDDEAKTAYNVLAARPDVELFLRANPDFGAAYGEYQNAEKLADLQKRFHIDDRELAAFVADYRRARDAPNIRKTADIETRVSAVSVAEANRELEGLTRRRSVTVDIDFNLTRRSIIVGSGVTPVYLLAHGGVLGGDDDDDEEHLAQIARAGAMRVWAEPETGGEAYIPLSPTKRPRSTSILAEVADRFGYALAPERPSVSVVVPSGLVDVLAGLRDAARAESGAARRLADVTPAVSVEAPDMTAVVRSNESVAAAVAHVARSIEGQRRPGNVDQSRTVNIGRIEHRTTDSRWLDDLAGLLR